MARRRNRRRFSPAKAVAGLLGFAALLGAVYVLLINYVFVVREVGVQMPQDCRFTAQQVAQVSGVKLGTRLDRIDEAEIAQNVLNSGWLCLEGVEVIYPDRLQITVSQRRPAALVSHVSTLLVTDSDGIMIEQVSGDPGYPGCVYITDIDIRRAHPGQRLQAADNTKIDAMVMLLKGLEEVSCQDLISWASVAQSRAMRLYSGNHVYVELGDGSRMPDKLRLMEAALTDMIHRGESLGTLNVSSGIYADYAPQN